MEEKKREVVKTLVRTVTVTALLTPNRSQEGCELTSVPKLKRIQIAGAVHQMSFASDL